LFEEAGPRHEVANQVRALFGLLLTAGFSRARGFGHLVDGVVLSVPKSDQWFLGENLHRLSLLLNSLSYFYFSNEMPQRRPRRTNSR